jgi:hypothetical protein
MSVLDQFSRTVMNVRMKVGEPTVMMRVEMKLTAPQELPKRRCAERNQHQRYAELERKGCSFPYLNVQHKHRDTRD